MSVISTKKKSLCIPKKYNNFNSIEAKSSIELKNGYINNQFYAGVLYYSKFNSLYDITLYNTVNQNNVFSLTNGYIKINKSISFSNSFYIGFEISLDDYNINQILMMNDYDKKGFRLSLNKFGYQNQLLFQLYTKDGKIELAYQLKQLFDNFNKIELNFKDNKIQLYVNDDLDAQKNIESQLVNSDKNLVIGSYFYDDKYFNTLNGKIKNILISQNAKLF